MTPAMRQTRLFTLRIWHEKADAGQFEWRGKVQALPEGDAYYFRNLAALVVHLQAMLEAEHVRITSAESLQEGAP